MEINKKYLEKIIMINILVLIGLLFYFNINKQLEQFNPDNKLIVIIPIRDREEHLNSFLKNIIPIFKYQDIDYKIYIIEQIKGKKFNKAKINNVGFLESTKDYPDYNRILFNDVDNYPLYKKGINYKTKVKGFHHFFGDPRWLGGFFMTNQTYFKKVNGYSNEYWGWGGEDNDLLARINAQNINVIRNVFYKRFQQDEIVDIDHVRENKKDRMAAYMSKMKLKKESYKKDIKNIFKDGLNNIKYTVKSKKMVAKNIIRILVDI